MGRRRPKKRRPPPDPDFCGHCRKVTYATPKWAYRMALHYSTEHGHASRVYRCPRRNGWHLTTRPMNAPTNPSR